MTTDQAAIDKAVEEAWIAEIFDRIGHKDPSFREIYDCGFRAGIAHRDAHPSPEVLALVEALEMFVGYCTDEFAPTPMKHARLALAAFKLKGEGK